MNTCQKVFSVCLLTLLTQAAFAQSAPTLGTASSFAVLSAAPDHGGAVTCTRSDIDGDVGSSGFDASVTQTNCTITGAVIAPVSANVIKDFNDAYAALADVKCDVTLPAPGNLAGLILAPGVYCVDAASTTTSGTLTLNGGSTDTWLFKIGNTAVGALTGTDFSVVMADRTPVPACNVTWWVEAATTMTRGAFNGVILAGAAITLEGTVHTAGTPPVETFAGQALATAAVTLTDVAFIGCESSSRGGKAKSKCNQGVGNGPENCDPGNSNQDGHNSNPFNDGTPARNTNDELGGTPGNPGRQGGNIK
jgi:hypothetical protein